MIHKADRWTLIAERLLITFFPGMKTVMPIQWDNWLENNTILAKKQRWGTIPGTRRLT